jgi:excisionase family DNA binding protein
MQDNEPTGTQPRKKTGRQPRGNVIQLYGPTSDLNASSVTIEELAELHRVTTRTVRNWMRGRLIPFIRIGRVLRFNPLKVQSALNRFERQEETRGELVSQKGSDLNAVSR